MSHRTLATRRWHADLHISAANFAERLPTASFNSWQSPTNDCEICFLNCARFELSANLVICICSARDKNHSRRFSIQTMQKSIVSFCSKSCQRNTLFGKDPVHQAVIEMPDSRLSHHPGHLIQSKDILVRINFAYKNFGIGGGWCGHASIIADHWHRCPPHT